MKHLVELTKIEEAELPQIYCDMDMVICDFIGGYEQLTGLDFAKTDKEERWEEIKVKKDFWATLDWMPGSQRMWKLINKYQKTFYLHTQIGMQTVFRQEEMVVQECKTYW